MERVKIEEMTERHRNDGCKHLNGKSETQYSYCFECHQFEICKSIEVLKEKADKEK